MKSSMPVRITQHAAKKPKPAAPPTIHPWRRYIPLILVVILLCGLGLRLCGLSHGLHLGEVYHPDTPRLMWAARQFLEGNYFFRINNPDYDGYPYFYSHVVEWLWRAVRGVSSLFSHLILGADRSAEPLHHEDLTNILFWLARLTNVILSMLVIFIVYRIAARNLDQVTGLIAAGLMAISPMNISMAHFAANDTMVFFFTTLTVLFAVRICTAGRQLDYLLGGILVACSFSAKYHGGIVGLTCILAHVLRYWPPRKWISKDALSRVGLLVLAFLVTFIVTNPALLVSPGKAFHDMRKYCQYIPSARLTEAETHMGLFGRAGLSLSNNVPVLVRSIGLIMSVLGLAGVIRAFFRGRRFAVLASFPIFYFVFTILTKPVQQRLYPGALFPIMFLLAAALLVELARIKKIKAATTTAVVLLLSPAAFYLLKSSLKEVFFFSHRDTRHSSKEWAQQNIPPSFKIKSGDYTFHLKDRENQTDYNGTIFLSSSIRPAAAPDDAFLLKVFDLEKDALPLFRNPRIEIRAQSSPLLSKDFALPAYQRIPSRTANEFVFADGPTFYQDEKIVELGSERPVSKIIVSAGASHSAVVAVRNGSTPGTVRIRLGGASRTFFLDPCETRWREVTGLKECFPSDSARHFYKLSASTNVPRALIVVAFTSEEKGVALYNIGEYAAASPFLAEASRKSKSPVLAAMTYISGKLSTAQMSPADEKSLLEKASVLGGDLTPEMIASTFGVSLEYLSALPYLSFKPDKRSARGFHPVEHASASDDSALTLDREPPPDGIWRIETPPLLLEPGCYVAAIRVRCEPPADPSAMIKISLLERGGEVTLSEKEFALSLLSHHYSDLQFAFEKPVEVAECWVSISSTRHVPLFLDAIQIRPDPVKSLRALQGLLKIVTSAPDSLPSAGSLDYVPLLHLGNQRFSQGQHHDCLPYYLLAHKLRPDLAEPVRRIRMLSTGLTTEDRKIIEELLGGVPSEDRRAKTKEADVLFSNGMRLTGYAINRDRFKPEEKFAISLYWSVPRTRKLPEGMVAWMHFLDERGKRAFQLDHYLKEDVCFPQKPERLVPVLTDEAQIPDGTAPGKYRIQMGLWIPLRDWRPRILSSPLPHTRYSATIGEIVIEPR